MHADRTNVAVEMQVKAIQHASSQGGGRGHAPAGWAAPRSWHPAARRRRYSASHHHRTARWRQRRRASHHPFEEHHVTTRYEESCRRRNAIAFAATTNAAQDAVLIPSWDASDETSTATIDHAPWQRILDAYLVTDHPSGINRFDYGALKANDEDFRKLGGYLTALARLDPRTYSGAEQKAYWINVYNALTVYVIAPRFPVDSIKDIKSGIIDFGPWNLELFPVQGQTLTLNDIEHGILRPIGRTAHPHRSTAPARLSGISRRRSIARQLERLLEQGRPLRQPPARASGTGWRPVVASIYDWWDADYGGQRGRACSSISALLRTAPPRHARATTASTLLRLGHHAP